MTTATVWLMIFYSFHASAITGAQEFTTKERCETAAVQMVQAVNDERWGMNIKKPICIKVEK